MFIKIRTSDNAVVDCIQNACGDCENCPNDEICFVIEKEVEFIPCFTEIKWVYEVESDSFINTGLKMVWFE